MRDQIGRLLFIPLGGYGLTDNVRGTDFTWWFLKNTEDACQEVCGIAGPRAKTTFARRVVQNKPWFWKTVRGMAGSTGQVALRAVRSVEQIDGRDNFINYLGGKP